MLENIREINLSHVTWYDHILSQLSPRKISQLRFNQCEGLLRFFFQYGDIAAQRQQSLGQKDYVHAASLMEVCHLQEGYDSETVQDVMLGAVERRFGSNLPTSLNEWLTDNGSAYRSHQTRQFDRMVGLEPKHTGVRSPENNGVAKSFVKTMKRDYISIMPKSDGLTAVKNLAEAFEHYN